MRSRIDKLRGALVDIGANRFLLVQTADKECMEVLGCGFVQVYGTTETTGNIVAPPPEDHVEEMERMHRRRRGNQHARS